MKGIKGAQIIRDIYGHYIVRIECKDRDTAEKVMRKLRIVGIFARFKGDD